MTNHTARCACRPKEKRIEKHAVTRVHPCTRPRKGKRSKHTTREATKDTVLKILKHATNQIAANMQTCMCEDTKDTKEPKDRVDVKDANQHPRDHAHAHTAETLTIAKTRHANWQTKLPSPPPPTHAKSCVITRNPDPSQRQHAYANETTHDRRLIGAYAPDPP